MNNLEFIKIEQSRCVRCLQCLRSCEVNAIKYIDNQLYIDPDRCVNCGICYESCSYGAVSVRNDVLKTISMIAENKTVVASVSPTWVSEFRGVSMNQFVLALKSLGFTHVSQATLGAKMAIEQSVKDFKESDSPLLISSICPVVRRMIESYYPSYKKYHNDISKPETLHGRLLKKWYGEDTQVVYVSSCVASVENKSLDGAITYANLKEWLDEANVDVTSFPIDGENRFEPYLANGYHGYQLVSSAIDYFPDIDVQSASGLKRVMSMLQDINVNDIEDKIYLELFACSGGCLTSVGSIDKNNMLAKKLRFDKHIRDSRACSVINFPEIDFRPRRNQRKMVEFASAQDKEAVLRKLNISKSGSLFNCGACGYSTCDKFANAVVFKMADVHNCVWHQKNSIAENLRVSIENIPYGFFILNKALRFEYANTLFSSIIGVDLPVLLGKKIDIDKLLPFSSELKNMFINNNDNDKHEVIVNGKVMILELKQLPGGVQLLGSLKSNTTNNSFDDTYVESVRKAVEENISSIQKIAMLLGENVARTESVFSSIISNKSK